MCASFYLNFCVFLEFTALLQKKPKHFSAKKMITYGMLFHLFFTISLLLRDYLKKKKKLHVTGCYVYLPGQNKTLFLSCI